MEYRAIAGGIWDGFVPDETGEDYSGAGGKGTPAGGITAGEDLQGGSIKGGVKFIDINLL